MTPVTIRKKLVDYMKIADEKKVKAIYTLLQEDIEQEGRVDIEQYNIELDKAEAEFKGGEFISNSGLKKKIKQW